MFLENVINRATKTAEKSSVIRGKIAAVLYTDNGHIIAFAHNETFLGHKTMKTIHAEQFLLLKANKINAVKRFGKNLNVLVLRWKPGSKKLANAKPCINCQRELAKTDFNIFYTDNDGLIKQL